MTLPDKDSDPVVLIHGAWAGSWVWDRLVPRLEAAGLACHAIDLPGNGTDSLDPALIDFQSYLDRVDDVVGRLTAPVSLVAHSGGGNVASAFAEHRPERVSRIVYVAGIMLPDGMSFVDIVDMAIENHPDAVGVNPSTMYSPDRRVSQVPPEAAIAHFFNDCDAADARAAAHRLSPQGEGGRAIVMRTTAARFGRIPRLYVEALNDKSVILPVQRLMQSLSPGAQVASLPTGHAPQLSAPDQLAATIIPFLRTSRKNLASDAPRSTAKKGAR
jgi:pimeloyl-ACP methyl ester carboxylesterase